MHRFLLGLLLVPALAWAQGAGAKRDPMQHFFSPSLGDLQAEAAAARAAGKQGLCVMYLRDDCPYCERMKANILSLPAVQAHYRQQFAVLAVDTRGALPMVDFAGRPATEKDFARAQGVWVTPTVVFYDLDGRPIARVAGEIRTAEEFTLLGDFVATGAYRTRSFAAYKQSNGNKKGT